MSTWQLYQQSQHYLPFLLMSQTSIADIQGPIKKKTNHNWYFSRYIHYRNLGDLHEKERRELQENQVREPEYSFTIVNVEEKKKQICTWSFADITMRSLQPGLTWENSTFTFYDSFQGRHTVETFLDTFLLSDPWVDLQIIQYFH